MHFAFVFIIITTSIVLVQCYYFVESNDFHEHKVIDCKCANRPSVIDNRPCQPRNRSVALRPMPGWSFKPPTVTVQQCDCGDCGTEICTPISKRNVTRIVKVHATNSRHLNTCAEVTVEEHTDCKSMCRKKVDCNEKQEYHENKCACVCINRKKLHFHCINQKIGMIWDDNDCTCKCTQANMQCTTPGVWNKKKCECVTEI